MTISNRPRLASVRAKTVEVSKGIVPMELSTDKLTPKAYPYIPGMTPAGYKPVGTPPPGTPEQQYSWWQHLGAGFVPGWNYSVESKPWGFTRSALWHRAPVDKWQDMNATARTGYMAGRIAGDVLGLGSRSLVWRIHPADLAGTTAMGAIKQAGGNRSAEILGLAATTTALDVASGNINYLNPGESGRIAGYAATVPDEEDPRISQNAALEYINRAVLGRTGKLLPWEEFSLERPNVSYEDYEAYKDYLRDPGMLLGVAKGTWDGIDGPEARVMGYRVTPLGILGAAAAIGGGVLATKRFAGLRK